MSGYSVPFTPPDVRTGRKAVPAAVVQTTAAKVRRARENTVGVKGARLFNLMPVSLRNSNHGDIEMFKNHLDIYLSNIPDQPTIPGLIRGASSNSLIDQVPMYENSF